MQAVACCFSLADAVWVYTPAGLAESAGNQIETSRSARYPQPCASALRISLARPDARIRYEKNPGLRRG